MRAGLIIISLLFLPGCGFNELFDGTTPASEGTTSPPENSTASQTLSLALGGEAPGNNELKLSKEVTAGHLSFEADPDIVSFEVKDNGAALTPKNVGVAIIHYFIDGQKQEEVFKVIIPPQSLIQILVAEAKTELFEETTMKDKKVAAGSHSPTGEALASAIKNRIALIVAKEKPSLFNANAARFDSKPPQSHYDAVIEANGQFKPVDPQDPNHDLYLNAAKRENFSQADFLLIVYDQALLSAAGVFSGDLLDPTNGAFAFRSPNELQWTKIKNALESQTSGLPDGIGVSDAIFPSLAPVQVFIYQKVFKKEPDKRSAFIFTRSRFDNEVAVTDRP